LYAYSDIGVYIKAVASFFAGLGDRLYRFWGLDQAMSELGAARRRHRFDHVFILLYKIILAN